jgi:hypothetical protein
MSQFYIVNESTEDTIEAADNLQDAIRVAKEVARQGQAGDPVSVLESGGKAVRQFVLLPDGTVAEQAIAGLGKLSPILPDLNSVKPGAAADPAGDIGSGHS